MKQDAEHSGGRSAWSRQFFCAGLLSCETIASNKDAKSVKIVWLLIISRDKRQVKHVTSTCLVTDQSTMSSLLK